MSYIKSILLLSLKSFGVYHPCSPIHFDIYIFVICIVWPIRNVDACSLDTSSLITTLDEKNESMIDEYDKVQISVLTMICIHVLQSKYSQIKLIYQVFSN